MPYSPRLQTNSYREERTSMTVAGAIEHWLDNRKPEVKAPTWETYRRLSSNNIVGPLLIGTSAERGCYRAHEVCTQEKGLISLYMLEGQ